MTEISLKSSARKASIEKGSIFFGSCFRFIAHLLSFRHLSNYYDTISNERITFQWLLRYDNSKLGSRNATGMSFFEI